MFLPVIVWLKILANFMQFLEMFLSPAGLLTPRIPWINFLGATSSHVPRKLPTTCKASLVESIKQETSLLKEDLVAKVSGAFGFRIKLAEDGMIEN